MPELTVWHCQALLSRLDISKAAGNDGIPDFRPISLTPVVSKLL